MTAVTLVTAMKALTAMTATTGVTAMTAMADYTYNTSDSDSGACAVFIAGTESYAFRCSI